MITNMSIMGFSAVFGLDMESSFFSSLSNEVHALACKCKQAFQNEFIPIQGI